MSNPVGPSTQYGDFKGTVSIDQADGGDLLRALAPLANVPRDYTPVGFNTSGISGGGRPGHGFTLTVYAVDGSNYGDTDELRKTAQSTGKVTVFSFREKVDAGKLAALILQHVKRFSIIAQTRLIRDADMLELHDT
jgi:hypothetical protein